MTRDEIRDVVLEIIEDINDEEDLTKIDGDKALRDQIELDSMDFLDIVMELRKRFQIQIPEEDYSNFETLNKSVDYLEPLLADK